MIVVGSRGSSAAPVHPRSMSRLDPGMHSRIVRAMDIESRDLQRWRALAERAIEPNAYLDPRWLHTSVLSHPDAAGLQLILIEDQEDLRGVFAFTIERAWKGAPFKAVSTAGRFLDMHAERHHPLVDRDHVDCVMRELISAMPRSGAGLSVLRKFPGDGPLAIALESALDDLDVPREESLRRRAAYARAGSIHAPDTAPDFRIARASSRTQKRFRNYANGIEREAGELRLRDRAGDPAGVDTFLRLQATGWKGDPARGGLAMRASPVTEAWFTRIIEAFARDGDLSVVELSAGGRTIFAGISLASGGVWAGFLDAYDEQFSIQRAGSLGRIAELNHLARAFPDRDMDPNLDPYYEASSRLYPDGRDRVNLVLAPGGMLPRTLLHALPHVRGARNSLRTGIGRLRAHIRD